MRRYGIALTLTALAAFVPAGHSRLAAATGARLTAITATGGAAPAVLIEASEPVAYRTARPDPFTVLVDLRNVVASGYANGFTARPESPVTNVAVESARDEDGQQVARIRVSLSEPISHRVRSQRNLIFVELSGDAAIDGAPAAVAAPRASDVPSANAGARVLQDLRLASEGGVTSITLVGNGRLAPSHVERAGTRRLYLDFPGVLADVPPVTLVNRGPVERVRVALNSQKPVVTRVVVDLERPATHLVESVGDGREVKITFRETGVSGPPVAAPAPAPMPGGRAAGPAPEPDAVVPATVVAREAPAQAATPAPAAAPVPVPAAPTPAPAAAQAVSQAPGTPGKQYTGHPISLDFQGADLRAVLRTPPL